MEAAAREAQIAARQLAGLDIEIRNHMLVCIKEALQTYKDAILTANQQDVELAQKSAESGPLIKRLNLSGDKYDGLLEGLDQVVALPDPLGKLDLRTEISEDLILERVSCPIGVLCIIYEARPEAGVQIASLSIKSGNALILKGGKEATFSNQAIYRALVHGLEMSAKKYPEVPVNAIRIVNTREDIATLLSLDQYIDLVIPRGSNALVKSVKEKTKIPVLGHADGICHVYVDEDFGDLSTAVKIVVDSKLNYPAACNALECLLVHSSALDKFLPALANATEEQKLIFHADHHAIKHLPENRTVPATQEDYGREYLCAELCVKTVSDLSEAVEYINAHSSHHTDSIVTTRSENAAQFQRLVDSASVYVNCSTRFADGYRYGFGAEVGISTSKIHTRGPVGVEGLVIYKYLMTGKGHCVGEMSTTRKYTHKSLL